MAIPGTKILSSSGLQNAESLINSKLTGGVTLASGHSKAVVQLSGQQNVNTVTFNNDGVDGVISVGGSTDNKDWINLGSEEFKHDKRVIEVRFATATVKYLSVSFQSAKGGTIRSFQVAGTSTDRDFSLVPDAGKEAHPVNFATFGGARAIFAFPTPMNLGGINRHQNTFQFPQSSDKYRTVVYDLGEVRQISEFATSYSQRPVRVEVFALESLPEKRDWRGKLTLDPTLFDSLKPVAVGEDAAGTGYLKITAPAPVTAGYVALRFEMNYQQNDATALLDVGRVNLMGAVAGPFGFAIAGAIELPEARYAKSSSGDLTVGDIEINSAARYALAPNSLNSISSFAGNGSNAGSNGIAIGSGPAVSYANGSAPKAVPTAMNNAGSNASNGSSAGSPSSNAAQASAASKIAALSGSGAGFGTTSSAKSGSVASSNASNNSQGATQDSAYTAGLISQIEQRIEKSFSSKVEAGRSRKNDWNNHRDDHGDHGGGNDHGPPHSP